mmetsp:Transcript_3786/g.10805  ORF Transcript_3786/g.10805 Transcript_3786/m.10805 type:complete len:204 (+) Transcript_3786:196-807(+)
MPPPGELSPPSEASPGLAPPSPSPRRLATRRRRRPGPCPWRRCRRGRASCPETRRREWGQWLSCRRVRSVPALRWAARTPSWAFRLPRQPRCQPLHCVPAAPARWSAQVAWRRRRAARAAGRRRALSRCIPVPPPTLRRRRARRRRPGWRRRLPTGLAPRPRSPLAAAPSAAEARPRPRPALGEPRPASSSSAAASAGALLAV